MPGVSLAAVAALAGGLLVFVIAGLAALSLALRAQRRHRNRLARVGRRRMSGRLDLDDVRLSLARAGDEASLLTRLGEALGRIVPVLDATRLRASISRAGMSMTLGGFIIASLVVGAGAAGVARLVTGAPLPLLAPAGVVFGMMAVNAFVNFRGEALADRFMRQLPEALDTIIRGVRSGLPVIECIGVAGQECPAPVGPHFRSISERVQLGEPLEAALWRVARVINKPEMDFLAVSISIQIETGGSLAEALGNLSDLLRKREHMKMKIKAVSSEAKASAMIIGALPFVMLGLLSVMSPEYVLPLFVDARGQVMLAAAMASICTGAFVMWRMTKFEI
ncbi:type II secretion system F family protein [Amaricoccus sp.]|uniref:type II secretion system F family protein n=1 Tax=Amaricoccus sp. TaxID=1872485 RepID=UPI001B5FB0CD|nr:type II secretion system F family protein [Amaricoccus sp.]MBP7243298.1 type II secretion system F family protein [Amaricoccus sp.]